jgi:hypothetical protein
MENQFDEESSLTTEEARAIFRAAENAADNPVPGSTELEREAAFLVHVASEPAYVISDILRGFDSWGDPLLRSRQIADLIREIAGNPFRPVAFSPEWRTDTAVSLARQMYEARDFSAMPILADALQDAGCDSADILDHCRRPVPHVRGCWVVDLVLDKE